MAELIDFDAWRSERKSQDTAQEGPKIQVGGKEYTLPSTIPASVALDVVRYKRARGDDAMVPGNMLINIGDSLFGADTWEAILRDNQLDTEEMGQLIMMAFAAYDEPEEEAVPNPKTPKQRKRST